MDFEYVLLVLGIILALVLIYFGYTHMKKSKPLNNGMSSSIDVEALLQALGGASNITDVKSSPSKVTVGLKEHTGIHIEKIRELGASGIVEGKQNISMIFGKQSPLIEEDLKKMMK